MNIFSTNVKNRIIFAEEFSPGIYAHGIFIEFHVCNLKTRTPDIPKRRILHETCKKLKYSWRGLERSGLTLKNLI